MKQNRNSQISSLTTVFAALGMPPPHILTPLLCPLLRLALLPIPAPLTAPLTASAPPSASLTDSAPLPPSLTGPALLPGPLALPLPRPAITVFEFFQKHHSSKSFFYSN